MIVFLGAVAAIAVVTACAAIAWALNLRTALRANEAKQREGAERHQEPAAVVTRSSPAAGSDPAFAERKLTAPVLVVEDEPGVRELIRLILVRAGREVVAVAGPHAALSALRRQPAVSLMLIDVVMPEMDGYDLAAEARTILPGVQVVFMSAFARDAARHPTSDGFLPKPFTVESLNRVVEEALAVAGS